MPNTLHDSSGSEAKLGSSFILVTLLLFTVSGGPFWS